MPNIFTYLPELEGEELMFVQRLTNDFDEQQLAQFAVIYRNRRKDPTLILLTALVGFLGISGIHRFLLNQIGMGILYLLTAGLCFIGTIIDLINHRKLAFEYNSNVAREVATIIKRGM
ncbi:MAG: TM2 domain-containing protein [Ignavibacteria bacterium]|jgi:TM2 domain-containing membrane protein YozV|nr:TM2 domain-containing protein [Ignavibacteria bacterium]MDH7528250.1 TM2 domain-containing protein [Ignavibacteria bacterium]NPV12592.1 TM2 domain-containing protein [Ignavibacteria bacterium]